MDRTSGMLWSTLYVSPVKSPLPAPAPPSGLPLASAMESSSTRFSPSVPKPLSPLIVTEYVAPLPATTTGVVAVKLDRANAKSAASTPVTGSLNVTV